MKKSDLGGQVAIITGASSGAGWEIARQLSRRGVKLCISARRTAALETLRAELVQSGGDCLVVPADVTQDDEVHQVVETCLRHFGRLDLLVTCAGVRAYGEFEALEWKQIDRIFDVNCFGPMRFARAVLPHFRKENAGQIIAVVSMLAETGLPLLSANAAAHHALLGWVRSLSLELRQTNITVSHVVSPSLATPLFDHAATLLHHQPKPLPPTYPPEVVGRAVVRIAGTRKHRAHPGGEARAWVWLGRLLPSLSRGLLGRYGEELQLGEKRVDREDGNLFEPIEEGVGPSGSVEPTPAWMRLGVGVAALVLTTVGAGGLTMGAFRLLRGAR